MRSFSNFISGLLLGGAVGFAVTILLAPYSGEQMRGQLQSEASRIQLEVKKAATERRTELEHQLASLRAPKPS